MNINNPDVFPTVNRTFPYKETETLYDNNPSLTLLDYFAAKAMQSIYMDFKLNGFDVEKIASDSYQIAKTMLIEREKVIKEIDS